MKNILIVTGGSGGHVIPSISFFEHLKNKYSIKIVTDLRGSKFIDKNKFDYHTIDVPNLFTKLYLFPINIFKYFINIFKSLLFIKKNRIDIIVSTGGYMAFPYCLAAFILKKKIFLFEPNSVLGRSNKLTIPFSHKIMCTDQNLKNFPSKYNSKKIEIYPILRRQLYELKKNSVNSKDKFKIILIIGGSQGASFFDDKISKLIVEISKNYKIKIIQQISDKGNIKSVEDIYKKEKVNYKLFEFTDNITHIYQNVDLAITRGGANTLSELSFLKIPFISIPLPNARDNHQFYNSNFYYQKKGCWIIDQNKFELKKSINLILEILNNNEDYKDKINNLDQINKKNTWNNVNNRIIEIINED